MLINAKYDLWKPSKTLYIQKILKPPTTSFGMYNEILNCKRPVSVELAILIEAALGIEANMLIRMQTDYHLQVARKNSKIMNKFSEIKRIASFL